MYYRQIVAKDYIALSVRDPWARAIIYLGKDVENRTWAPSEQYIGSTLLIHVSQKDDGDELLAFVHGSLVKKLKEYPKHLGAIIGSVQLVGFDSASRSRWAEPGCVHWLLSNPKPLRNPVPWKGRLGIFRVPESAVR